MKSKFIFLFIALSFSLISVNALPDLQANWLQYYPSTQKLVIEIQNTSNEPITEFQIDFFADSQLISTELIDSLPENSTMSIPVDFSISKTTSFKAVLDSENEISKSNESNNEIISLYEVPVAPKQENNQASASIENQDNQNNLVNENQSSINKTSFDLKSEIQVIKSKPVFSDENYLNSNLFFVVPMILVLCAIFALIYFKSKKGAIR